VQQAGDLEERADILLRRRRIHEDGALRAVARKIHATRQATANAAGAPPIDPDAEEVQQLKSAAMPLLFQLREDQKNEVRKLARIIGLEKVAAAI